jgi:glycosyltransferase involved in cell wall biosynthesis
MKDSAVKVSIITFADLGKFSNYKSPAILSVIKKLDREKVLNQVICRRSKDFYFHSTKSINSFIFYLYKIFLIPLSFLKINTHSLEKKILDIFISKIIIKKIDKNDVFFIHPPYFSKTLKKIKNKGAIVVGITTNPFPGYPNSIIAEEYKKFNLKYCYPNEKNLVKSIKELDYVVAYSSFVKKSYIENGFLERKIFIAVSDIDINNFSITKTKEDPFFKVLYVSHTGIRKGLTYLIDAFEKLTIPNKKLIIVGKINFPKKIKKKIINKINKNTSIEWHGPKKNIHKYYEEASVFVLPSFSEGNPKVVMEAMASGLPVITTENAPSIIENQRSGFIVPIRNSNIISKKIEFLHNNPQIAKKMGENARKAIENKKPFGEKIFEIYKEIIKIENFKT